MARGNVRQVASCVPNHRWEQSLASDSEAIVKAERMPKDLTPEDLQKISVDLVQAGEVSTPGSGGPLAAGDQMPSMSACSITSNGEQAHPQPSCAQAM